MVLGAAGDAEEEGFGRWDWGRRGMEKGLGGHADGRTGRRTGTLASAGEKGSNYYLPSTATATARPCLPFMRTCSPRRCFAARHRPYVSAQNAPTSPPPGRPPSRPVKIVLALGINEAATRELRQRSSWWRNSRSDARRIALGM